MKKFRLIIIDARRWLDKLSALEVLGWLHEKQAIPRRYDDERSKI